MNSRRRPAAAAAGSRSTTGSIVGSPGSTPSTVDGGPGAEPGTIAFTQYFSLTVTKAGNGAGAVSSNPAGIDCGGTCSVSYNSGTSVTLTATPTTGSLFAGWSGACTGTGACVVVMDQARSVTATFNVPPLSRRRASPPTKRAPQPASTTITFTATAANGTAPYQYKWWVYNGSTWSNPQNWSTDDRPSPGRRVRVPTRSSCGPGAVAIRPTPRRPTRGWPPTASRRHPP